MPLACLYIYVFTVGKIKSKVKTPDTQESGIGVNDKEEKLKPAIWIMNEHKRTKS